MNEDSLRIPPRAPIGGSNLQYPGAVGLRNLLLQLLCFSLLARASLNATPTQAQATAPDTSKLRALIEASLKLPLQPRKNLLAQAGRGWDAVGGITATQ